MQLAENLYGHQRVFSICLFLPVDQQDRLVAQTTYGIFLEAAAILKRVSKNLI